MLRNLATLAARDHDLVIVGGGIFGLCAAWDAVQRGLSVALVERDDFAAGASANCFKIIHGGIRYLQHGDLPRVRQSAGERNVLLRIAPHLTEPLPILVPTRGAGRQGRALLRAGMAAYDLLCLDRNRGIEDPAQHIPLTRSVSRDEACELFPLLEHTPWRGGALFHDGRMRSPARLALAFLQSAVAHGAQAANHAEATRLLRDADRVVGIEVRDRFDGAHYEVRGRVVLNATGGFAPSLVEANLGRGLEPAPTFSRDACFAVHGELGARCALALPGASRDPDAWVSRKARHLFLVPWRGATLIGVWHRVHRGDPARSEVAPEEVEIWVDEVNRALPALELTPDDVTLTQGGLVLFGENHSTSGDLSYGKRSLLVDHARTHGVEGLLTLVGVRYTTARAEAERVLERVFAKLGRSAPPCATAETPLFGGGFRSFAALLDSLRRAHPAVPPAVLRELLQHHGSEASRVLALAEEDPALAATLPGSDTLAASVVHAVRDEMARTLSDVVMRRTSLGAAGSPRRPALEATADLMGQALDWDPARLRKELDTTEALFPV